ncbi:pseudouridine synthase [Candidatus Allofournierella excrementavium]|uniref:pseudouridine synthase n=1 Tax=Candidatus Allofournierella excrementavium TaxID=2838591 RepID=UPI003AF17F13
MRLDKFVADAAQLTRSAARGLIAKGRVTVNGQVCKKADCALKEGDSVCADGKPLASEEYVYIMLNKPAGVVSASADGRDKTVVDLLGGAYPRRQLFPAGRLDKTSTGFVLLTDDGAFAHDILAPKRHVPKTYRVVLDTPVTPEMAEAFAAGVTLADGQTMQPARLIPDEADPFAATVVLRQGVYHQIKRMFGVLDAGVNELHRSAIGGLALDESLAPGAWRLITPEEKALLQAGAED